MAVPAVVHVFALLPQVGGHGYYSYSTVDRQYGTQRTISAIQDVCRQMQFNGDPEIGIGDISFANGAPMPPHVSHTNGRDVDIRPLRTDRRRLGVTIHDQAYDRAATTRLVENLRAQHNVRSILFNDAQIPGVQHWPGHDNHLHVIMHH